MIKYSNKTLINGHLVEFSCEDNVVIFSVNGSMRWLDESHPGISRWVYKQFIHLNTLACQAGEYFYANAFLDDGQDERRASIYKRMFKFEHKGAFFSGAENALNGVLQGYLFEELLDAFDKHEYLERRNNRRLNYLSELVDSIWDVIDRKWLRKDATYNGFFEAVNEACEHADMDQRTTQQEASYRLSLEKAEAYFAELNPWYLILVELSEMT